MKSTEQETVKPWYRQFWPWFIIALPLSAVIASIATVMIAVDQAPSLVVDDYAKIGLATHRKMERDKRAAELGMAAEVHLVAQSTRVEVRLNSHGTIQQDPVWLALSILHPTDETRDLRLRLEKSENGYVGELGLSPERRRYLQIEPPDQSWRLTGEWDPSTPVLALSPATADVIRAQE